MLRSIVIFLERPSIYNQPYSEYYYVCSKIVSNRVRKTLGSSVASWRPTETLTRYSKHGCCDFLDCLITEHLMLLNELFPKCLKPKHHFFLHYCRVMKLMGPLWNMSSMRFESKHREAKVTSHVSNSQRINHIKYSELMYFFALLPIIYLFSSHTCIIYVSYKNQKIRI